MVLFSNVPGTNEERGFWKIASYLYWISSRGVEVVVSNDPWLPQQILAQKKPNTSTQKSFKRKSRQTYKHRKNYFYVIIDENWNF